MEALKFVVLLLVAVFAQVYTVVLGSPLSSEVDGEMWSTDNWQVLTPRGISLDCPKFIIDFSKSDLDKPHH